VQHDAFASPSRHTESRATPDWFTWHVAEEKQWWIEIAGLPADLSHLKRFADRADIKLESENGRTYLKLLELAPSEAPREVLDRAELIIAELNGVGRIFVQGWENVGVAAVERRLDGKQKDHFLFPKPLVVTTRFGSAELTVRRPDGTIVPQPPDPILLPFKAAATDNAVAKVLRLHAADDLTYRDLYVIYEVIEADTGGKSQLLSQGWATDEQISRFKHSANSVSVLGDEARHGHEARKPPKKPMPLTEARIFVNALVKAWFRTK